MSYKKMLVGLCGRSGSGKGYVSKIFNSMGIPSVDTDAVYREITGPCDSLSECMLELVERFGDEVVSNDNSLNRPYLRSIVFSGNKEALDDLNRITHKHILKETLLIADKYCSEGKGIILVDAPLLFESGFDKMCRVNICVTAPEEMILKRIMSRDGISEEDAEKRLAVQKPREELEDRSDFIISNDTEKDILTNRIKECVEKLTEIYVKEYGYEV
ncbi:MAG: dephospho-CoA kinase [Ruminococcaceae bacterium]|nr:dephospho-CoA kinase [Oscillospiraceae bacterium]